MMNFHNQKVLVLGWARSGKAVTQLLVKLGAEVTVVNGGAFEQDDVLSQLIAQNVQFIDNDQNDAVVSNDFAYVVKNPGIPYEHPLLQKAKTLQVPIITEVAVALSQFKGRVLAITGSNGKTTTTSLVREFMTQSQQTGRVVTAGNIGTPVSEVVDKVSSEDTLLLELSSFQLMGTPNLQPDIALVTNLFSSHLDYHGTREAYLAAKFEITARQSADQQLILNWDNEDSRQFASQTQANVHYFSRTLVDGMTSFTRDGHLYYADDKIMALDDIALVGPHNLENILAAVTMAKLAGVDNQAIQQVLRTFGGVAHRLEFVQEVNGVKYYNDSKATDIEATQQALDSFTAPTILLAGGLDRGDDLTRLVPHLQHVKSLIVFGQTAEQMAAAGRLAGVTDIRYAQSVIDATPLAIELAQAGDIVLLSPAAASWDQFKNFEERGQHFVDAIQASVV
jgi:UDP-N-acetylmuramoylalanine--D-glutamate ligase